MRLSGKNLIHAIPTITCWRLNSKISVFALQPFISHTIQIGNLKQDCVFDYAQFVNTPFDNFYLVVFQLINDIAGCLVERDVRQRPCVGSGVLLLEVGLI